MNSKLWMVVGPRISGSQVLRESPCKEQELANASQQHMALSDKIECQLKQLQEKLSESRSLAEEAPRQSQHSELGHGLLWANNVCTRRDW